MISNRFDPPSPALVGLRADGRTLSQIRFNFRLIVCIPITIDSILDKLISNFRLILDSILDKSKVPVTAAAALLLKTLF